MRNLTLQKAIIASFLTISILTFYVVLSFADWAKPCKKGYERVSANVCKKIKIPDHAEITYGNNWKCKKGYLLSNDKKHCNKIYVPYNAHLNGFTGVGWACDDGYRPSGEECLKVELPENAHVTHGQTWQCNYGYKKLNNECVPN